MFKAQRVFERAEREGLNDAQLAARMGVPQSQVSRVRHGKIPVTAKFMRAARRAFPDATLDEMFEDEPEPLEAIA